MKHFNCAVCQNKLQFVLVGKDYLYKATKRSFKIYRCIQCKAEQITPLPTYSEIKTFYPKVYYSYIKSSKNIFLQIREKTVDIAYNKKTKRDLLYFLAKLSGGLLYGIPLKRYGKKRFLDIGCGNDYNMKLLEKYGWVSYGFEIGNKKRIGNIFYEEDINKVTFKKMTFDYIRIWHVLEHVTNPHAFIMKISQLLSKDGKIVIGVPNTNSAYAKIFKSYWYGRDIPRHVINYSPDTLRLLFKGHKLKIVKVKYLSVGGFWGSLQHVVNDQFKSNVNFINNILLVLLFLPVDLLLNLLHFGDSIGVEIVRE